MSDQRNESTTAPAPLGRTLRIVGPAKWRLLGASMLGAGAVAAGIGLMGTAAWLISRAAQHPGEFALGLAIVGVQFFGLSRGFFRYGERLVGHDAAFRLLADLRVTVYERLERLAPAGLPAFRSGDLLTRMVQDVDSLQDLVIRVVPPFIIAVVVGVTVVVIEALMLPAAAVILAICLLLAATVVPWATGLLTARREARHAEQRGQLSIDVVDLIDGAAELMAFGATDAQIEQIDRTDAALRQISATSSSTAGVGLGLTTLLAGIACWGSLVAGIPAVVAGTMPGTELAVITLIPLAAFELVVGLPTATQALQRARQAAARVFAVLDAHPTVSDPVDPVAIPAQARVLAAEGVWASYPGASAPALRGVDLVLRPNKRVALVGPSGSGKSTLASVLLDFLPVDAGAVTIDGVDVDRVDGDALRRIVGMVDQDAHLFDTTLAENLRMAKRSATDDDLVAVLERVHLGDWLAELPRGLATEVGWHGSRLSGGQRRRVAIARALLASFDVLILDEPGEHLDPVTADSLTQDLLEITDDSSVLLITHRLAGLECVDEICVMDAGRIVERGTHDELLTAGDRYAHLWWEEMRTERYLTEPDERRRRPTRPTPASPTASFPRA